MVSKGRFAGGFGGNDFSFAPETLVATDFEFNLQSRTLKFRATAGYSGNIGDVLILGVNSGKSVAVAEITNIGPDRSLLVKELEGIYWGMDFVRDVKKTHQRLFVGFVTPPARYLGIELYLGFNPGGDDLATDPEPVDTAIYMDGDGDGIITGAEAEAFVQQAEDLIKRPEGLTLGELAPSIPPRLKVSGVGLSGTGTNAEEIIFNGITGRARFVDGTPFLYFPFIEQATLGVRINGLGDVDPLVVFDDFMKEIRDKVTLGPKTLPLQEDKGNAWELSSVYIKLVDKVTETMVVKGGNIKSIKRVKKCGKRYYKLELEDRGFVPNIQPGNYEDCLAFTGVRPVC
jgi:hypothetical protein